MGGTFDPIHNGHLVAASEVADLFELDEVVFVPTGQPWQKSREVTPPEDRYLMTVIATASNPRFSVSRVDIDRGGADLHQRHAARPARTQPRQPTCTSSPAPTRSPRSCPGRTGRSCSPWRKFIGVSRPGYELNGQHIVARVRRAARGRADPGRSARPGHLVHRLPRPRRQGPTDLVPGARRCRAIRRQARPLPRPRPRGPDGRRNPRGGTCSDRVRRSHPDGRSRGARRGRQARRRTSSSSTSRAVGDHRPAS